MKVGYKGIQIGGGSSKRRRVFCSEKVLRAKKDSSGGFQRMFRDACAEWNMLLSVGKLPGTRRVRMVITAKEISDSIQFLFHPNFVQVLLWS